MADLTEDGYEIVAQLRLPIAVSDLMPLVEALQTVYGPNLYLRGHTSESGVRWSVVIRDPRGDAR